MAYPNATILVQKGTNNELVSIVLPDDPQKTTFFVLLHGLISLVEGDEEFRAYPLRMGEQHKYFFGNWLQETPMPGGILAELRGVKSSPKSPANSLDPKVIPVAAVAAFPQYGSDLSVGRIRLPRPAKLHLLNLGDVVFNDPQAKLLDVCSTVAGLVVFEYQFDGPSLPALGLWDEQLGAIWNAKAKTTFGANNVDVSSLHFVSQPANSIVADDHSQDEFVRSAEFLGVSGMGLQSKPKDGNWQPAPPAGLSHLELQPLDARRQLLDRFEDFARTGKWNSSEGLWGSDCKSCCTPLRATLK